MAITAALPAVALADTPDVLEIWPGGVAPGSKGTALVQKMVERSQDPARPDRYMEGITRPYLTIHRPARPDGRALLIMPGGGYQRVVVDKEGGELAPLLTAQGFTIFVLTYRLPGEAPQHGPTVALQDAQRAMRVIRQKAKGFRIDPDRLGVMGFSAGGHVAATLGTKFAETVYEPVDAADTQSAKPDKLALVYPVIDMGLAAHTGSRDRMLGPNPSEEAVARFSVDRNVTAQTPPTFLLHAADDTAVPVENSLLFHAACRKVGVAVEMHIYARGGHGFGHGARIAADNPLKRWPELFVEWYGRG
ncbi:alpha/beta hydrolase [Niveispirillum sp. KHB5.9]|uniref:alpha/beta hydrolase n=1 Tax=Niveispirillum sp. KHB5.9 TaxID=3400269 RepID=UPI003A855813